MVMRAGDGARLTRLAYQLGALMAREQLVAQDPASARRLLQSVAGQTSMAALSINGGCPAARLCDACILG